MNRSSSPAHAQHFDLRVGELSLITEDLYALRLPMPFRLNHINVYLIDTPEGWWLIDCGLDTPEARAVWEYVLPDILSCKRLARIIVTHYHPDHIGLAHWLEEKTGGTVYMTEHEWHTACRFYHERADFARAYRKQCAALGLPTEFINGVVASRDYGHLVRRLPRHVDMLEPGQALPGDAKTWHVLIGRGHAPQHACLWNAAQGILLAADQVLPDITPNISVLPWLAENPLRDYLESLEQFALLPCSLLLPAHGQPMCRYSERIRELQHHHTVQLARLREFCTVARTPYECISALFKPDLPPHQLSFALGEAAAHLVYLEQRGELARPNRDEWVFMRNPVRLNEDQSHA